MTAKKYTASMISFLDLPSEVRNRVYHCTSELVPALFEAPASAEDDYPLVIKGSLIGVLKPDVGDEDDNGNIEHTEYEPPLFFPPQPNISRTCRQVREETLPIFYGSNPIILTAPQEYCDIFTKQVVTWFLQVQQHVALMKDIYAPKTVIERLQEERLGFREGVLKEREEARLA